MNDVQKRIDRLEYSISFLENHLHEFGHLIQPKPLRFIRSQIKHYKRELQIRKDYPT
ncbi:MAG: hypothetical protein ACFFCV_20465 [Promethearchaeota archaeon]